MSVIKAESAGNPSPIKVERNTRNNTLFENTDKSNALRTRGMKGALNEQHPEIHTEKQLYYLDESNKQIVILEPDVVKSNLDPLSKFIYSCLLEAGELIEAQPGTLRGGLLAK